MADYLRVRDGSGRIIASDIMRSMRFVSKHDVLLTNPYDYINYLSSEPVHSNIVNSLIAVQSPRATWLGYGPHYSTGSGAVANRLFTMADGDLLRSYTARIFCFSTPSVTRQGGPGIRAYDSNGNICFNSADIGVRVAGVYTRNVSYTQLVNAILPYGEVFRINTGLPAGNYAVSMSPGYWCGDAVRNFNRGVTRLYRMFLTCHMIGTTIVAARANDFEMEYGYLIYDYYNQVRTLPVTFTVFDVTGL